MSDKEIKRLSEVILKDREKLSAAMSASAFLSILTEKDKWPNGVEIAQKLLMTECIDDVNMRDAEGSPVLILALKNRFPDVACALIERGAAMNAIDKYGSTPLIMAAKKGYENVVEIVLSKAQVNEKIKKHKKKRIKYVNKQNFHYDTALLCAVREGHKNIVCRLLEAGADVNAVNVSGFVPLRQAIIGHHISIARLLICYGAQVNDCSKPAVDCSLLGEAITEYMQWPKRGLGMIKLLMLSGAELAQWRETMPAIWPPVIRELFEREETNMLKEAAARRLQLVRDERVIVLSDDDIGAGDGAAAGSSASCPNIDSSSLSDASTTSEL